jgi:hypothetical protein
VAKQIRKVDYYYVTVPDKPGEAARVLSTLHKAGVNLLGFSGFPLAGRKSQLDFLPDDSAAFVRAAKQAGLKVSKRRVGFLLQGRDRPGAIAALLRRLARAGINVTAVQAACAGARRYGGLLWVKASDLNKAKKVLGAG